MPYNRSVWKFVMNKYRPFQAWFQHQMQVLDYEHVVKLQLKPQFFYAVVPRALDMQVFDSLVKDISIVMVKILYIKEGTK